MWWGLRGGDGSFYLGQGWVGERKLSAGPWKVRRAGQAGRGSFCQKGQPRQRGRSCNCWGVNSSTKLSHRRGGGRAGARLGVGPCGGCSVLAASLSFTA